jgi:2-polyprenyl-3-methyl-5-hydroxy-6-metoxy-1,4-benzoquinol methylase
MKIGAIPQNPLEWLVIKSNAAPAPLMHTQIAFVLSRAILCAFRFGIFETMKDGGASLQQIAAKTNLNERALHSLLNVLLSAGYFRYKNGTYNLTKMARKWCLKDAPNSVYNQQLFNIVCWDWMVYMDEFLQTGKGLQYHETFNDYEWGLYQKGMESVAASTAAASVKIAPKLSAPTRMLDIGGAHGIYSVSFCKKYPTLNATVLDLPPAVEKATPILAKYGMGDKVKHRAGNALTDDLGANEYDVILVSSLIHHFSKEQTLLLSEKISTALKPGGYYLIQEFTKPKTATKMEMIGSVLDLFFNMSSTAGNWSLEEIRKFQNSGGLKHVKINKFLVPPGYIQAVGMKK